MSGVRVDLPYLMADKDRHGNDRLYVRKHGKGKVRIRETPGTAAFTKAYAAALERLDIEEHGNTRGARTAPGTLRWLAEGYFASAEFKGLDKKSQATRRLVLEDCLREPIKPKSKDLMASCPIKYFGADHVLTLRDRKAELPGAANNRLKYLSAMFGWAVEKRKHPANPVRDVRPIQYSSTGFYTWTVDDVQAFEKCHPIGTKARLALALLLLTGSRRGDVVTFGKQHIRDGWLRFVPKKTSYRRKTLSEKPVLDALAKIIAASPTGDLTFLVTEYGKPFTAAGFGGWFRKRCDDAGLPHCSAHGLRKAGASIAAENGATDRELMALFDWTTASQASIYTQAADRRKMAAAGMKLLGQGQSENVSGPTDGPTEKIA
jgi:integrase